MIIVIIHYHYHYHHISLGLIIALPPSTLPPDTSLRFQDRNLMEIQISVHESLYSFVHPGIPPPAHLGYTKEKHDTHTPLCTIAFSDGQNKMTPMHS